MKLQILTTAFSIHQVLPVRETVVEGQGCIDIFFTLNTVSSNLTSFSKLSWAQLLVSCGIRQKWHSASAQMPMPSFLCGKREREIEKSNNYSERLYIFPEAAAAAALDFPANHSPPLFAGFSRRHTKITACSVVRRTSGSVGHECLHIS